MSICVVVVASAPAAHAATAAPRITKLSATAGPLAAHTLTLTGDHLRKVARVRFGKGVATRLRHEGDTTLTLRAPARRTAGRVQISAFRAGRWYKVGHYSYVARPTVTHLSSSTGSPLAGTSDTITGRNLGISPRVLFGTTTAKIRAHHARSLTVTVPPGLEGAVHVTVITPGGRSAHNSSTTYRYARPAAVDEASYVPAEGTVTATGVQWVSGGADPDDLVNTNHNPWIVSVSADASIPSVGDAYFLPPGGDVYSSGLAGTVESIASQQDGSTRLTIQPTALDDTLSGATVAYSDGPDSSAGTKAHRRLASVDTTMADEVSFPSLGPNVFDCKRQDDGSSISFRGEIGLRFEHIHPEFDLDRNVHPSFDAYITGSLVTHADVSVTASITCDLRQSWTDANRKIIPLGTTGATLSFGPTAELEISGAGTVRVEQSTNFMYGISKYDNDPVNFYKIARQNQIKSSGSSTASVELSFGLSVQVGILDRVGVEIKAELYANGTLTAQTSPVQVCVDVAVGVKVSIGAFLDLIVARWDSTAAEVTLEFSALHACTAPADDLPPDGNPQVTSDQLPDATVGNAYDTTLTTADDRLGHWDLVGGSLPPGLGLSDDGELSGTPTGGVGTRRVTVRFTDANGLHSDATLAIRVLPDSGLGGGDIQATLTWNSAADLDLHAFEPDGTEIYYGNPGPTDNDGALDHDANAACETVDPAPAENIHWPADGPESGDYQFEVQTYADCDTQDLSWHFVVRVRGAIVIDQTGYGDSDVYDLQYTAQGDGAQVRVLPARAHRRVSSTAKVARNR